MNTSCRSACLCLARMMCFLWSMSPVLADDVALNVRLRDDAAVPLVNFGILVNDRTGTEIARGITNSAGEVSFLVASERADRFVTMEIAVITLPGEGSAEAGPRQIAYQSVVSSKHLPTQRPVLVPEGATNVNVEFVATPAVHATICIQNSNGASVSGMVLSSASAVFGANSKPPSRPCVVLRGLVRGQDATMKVFGPGSAFLLMTVPGTVLMQDADLGVVALPSEGGDATIRCLLTNAEPGRRVSFIAASGELGYTAIVGSDFTTLSLPAGTYYVVPDRVEFAFAFWPLVAALRAGQFAQVDAAGVPKVTAVAGVTTEVTVSLDQSRDAMISIAVP